MRATDYTAIVAKFSDLPDDAVVPDPAAALLLSISPWTLRRNNPVRPIQISQRCRGRRAGDIRAFVRGAQPALSPST
jgi:hypothetical protein